MIVTFGHFRWSVREIDEPELQTAAFLHIDIDIDIGSSSSSSTLSRDGGSGGGGGGGGCAVVGSTISFRVDVAAVTSALFAR